MKINTKWNIKDRMLKNPTFEQKTTWYIKHAKFCSCRPIPSKLLEAIKKNES